VTLEGLCRLTLAVRRCHNVACSRHRRAYRPEEEGLWALPQGEFGLDVIALVGALRFGDHRSVPEIHRALQGRGVAIAERSVTHLLQRYEELVALRVTDLTARRAQFAQQGRVILALDGLQPDVGHEVLWVLRDCLSGEVLLARSLLSGTSEDLAVLVTEVRDALPVPITGVISDGQHPIREAVRRVLPQAAHQLCQFHYLREAAKPIFEADRHAKKELKKRVRGVRPIERALDGQEGATASAVRHYCLAVRSALTDDGRPPLAAAGLTLHKRLAAIAASIERVASKRGLPRELARLHRLVRRGLTAPATDWPALRTAYGWVHDAAHLLGNHDNGSGANLRAQYQDLLETMRSERDDLGTLASAIDHFEKVTTSYWPGLFHCYDVPDLPRTNNDLEHFFGSARYHERRASGRKQAAPATVVRGAVRLVAAVATRQRSYSTADLQLTDRAAWHRLRHALARRHDARRAQHRFRRDPAAYLAALEDQILKSALPP
jgi:hypothetical protein